LAAAIATFPLVLVSRMPVSPPATVVSPTAAAVARLAVTPGIPSLLISEINPLTVVAVVVSVLVVPSALVMVNTIPVPPTASVCAAAELNTGPAASFDRSTNRPLLLCCTEPPASPMLLDVSLAKYRLSIDDPAEDESPV
jgi:hypothetical protein